MKFRAARHTNDLKPIIEFYTNIIGLEVLGSFENHDDYNGVFLGIKDQDWHLEFTESNINAKHHFDDDDILVFYPSNEKECQLILEQIEQHAIKTIKPINPYWQKYGLMVEDPDEHKVVVSIQKLQVKS